MDVRTALVRIPRRQLHGLRIARRDRIHSGLCASRVRFQRQGNRDDCPDRCELPILLSDCLRQRSQQLIKFKTPGKSPGVFHSTCSAGDGQSNLIKTGSPLRDPPNVRPCPLCPVADNGSTQLKQLCLLSHINMWFDIICNNFQNKWS
jgi:hypothetical protein